MAKKSHPSPRVQGKVLAFNLSPKGPIDGALVETSDGIVQVNFERHAASDLARSMTVGGEADLEVELQEDAGDHPVYRAGGRQEQASGVIVQLNYALHGEVNGYHLDDRTFLHVGPGAARKHKLHVGEMVEAKGSRRPSRDVVVLEASSVQRLHLRPQDGV